jgi:hypothetical protein
MSTLAQPEAAHAAWRVQAPGLRSIPEGCARCDAEACAAGAPQRARDSNRRSASMTQHAHRHSLPSSEPVSHSYAVDFTSRRGGAGCWGGDHDGGAAGRQEQEPDRADAALQSDAAREHDDRDHSAGLRRGGRGRCARARRKGEGEDRRLLVCWLAVFPLSCDCARLDRGGGRSCNVLSVCFVLCALLIDHDDWLVDHDHETDHDNCTRGPDLQHHHDRAA